jgi:hypothetical protein
VTVYVVVQMCGEDFEPDTHKAIRAFRDKKSAVRFKNQLSAADKADREAQWTLEASFEKFEAFPGVMWPRKTVSPTHNGRRASVVEVIIDTEHRRPPKPNEVEWVPTTLWGVSQIAGKHRNTRDFGRCAYAVWEVEE